MAAKLLCVTVVLSSSLFCDFGRSQEIDFAVALNRRTTPPAYQPRAAVGGEIDWSSALQRRSVSQATDQIPSSWEQATVRAKHPPLETQSLSTKKPSDVKKGPSGREQALFFTAQWCGFCGDQKSYLSKRIGQMGLTMSESPDADFRMIDVEKFQNLKSEYQISSLPVVVYLDKSGREVDRVVGFDPVRLKTPQLQKLK